MPAPRILAIDIGGSAVKAMVFGADGKALSERARLPTPDPATPRAVLAVIRTLARSLAPFERVSAGFPGVVRAGVVYTAVNLHPSWEGVDLASALRRQTGRPSRVANDADVQGMGAVKGKGVELVVTLGTGFGSALFIDGRLVPNLELGHNPFRKGQTYEEQLGAEALDDIGAKRWNRRMGKALRTLERVFNYDVVYIGGGNARKLAVELPPKAVVVSNAAGLAGGVALWRTAGVTSGSR